MKKHPQDLIVRPLLSEKGTALQDSRNQYVFEVRKDANKIEIKHAVETLFKVEVVKVNTLRLPGKWKRVGRFASRANDWKKAMVTLREGQSIELFEGV